MWTFVYTIQPTCSLLKKEHERKINSINVHMHHYKIYTSWPQDGPASGEQMKNIWHYHNMN